MFPFSVVLWGWFGLALSAKGLNQRTGSFNNDAPSPYEYAAVGLTEWSSRHEPTGIETAAMLAKGNFDTLATPTSVTDLVPDASHDSTIFGMLNDLQKKGAKAGITDNLGGLKQFLKLDSHGRNGNIRVAGLKKNVAMQAVTNDNNSDAMALSKTGGLFDKPSSKEKKKMVTLNDKKAQRAKITSAKKNKINTLSNKKGNNKKVRSGSKQGFPVTPIVDIQPAVDPALINDPSNWQNRADDMFFVPVDNNRSDIQHDYIPYDVVPVDHSLWHGDSNLTIQSVPKPIDTLNTNSAEEKTSIFGARRKSGSHVPRRGLQELDEDRRSLRINRSSRGTKGKVPSWELSMAPDDVAKASADALKAQNQFTLYLPVNEHGMATDMPVGTDHLTYALEPHASFDKQSLDLFASMPETPKHKHKRNASLEFDGEEKLASDIRNALFGTDDDVSRHKNKISSMMADLKIEHTLKNLKKAQKTAKDKDRDGKNNASKDKNSKDKTLKNKNSKDKGDQERADRQNLISKLVSRFVDVDALASGNLVQALGGKKHVDVQSMPPMPAADPFNTPPEFISGPPPHVSHVAVDIPPMGLSENDRATKNGQSKRTNRRSKH